jgi:hypothetical protein
VRRAALQAAAALLALSGGAEAGPLSLWFDAVSVGVEAPGEVLVDAGLDPRPAVRLGTGVALGWGPHLQVAAGVSSAAGTTDFGLLGAPHVRLERRDVDVELRLRAPWAVHGFRLQAVAGLGRRTLAHRPDRLRLEVDGGPLEVELPAVHAGTQLVAAEVLHRLGTALVVLRGGWRTGGLDVATPEGTRRRRTGELQIDARLRVALF